MEQEFYENICIERNYECTSPSQVMKNNYEEDSVNDILEKIPKLNEIFTIYGKIGQGTFSSVFLAKLKQSDSNKLFAIKHLVPTCLPSRVERELRYLKDIGGIDNVIGLHFCIRNAYNVAFVMPFIKHERFVDYFLEMDSNETALYIRNLLIALNRVHSFKVIHRDVKPSNFLYDRKNKKFQLVDFGLAHDVASSLELHKPTTTKSVKRKLIDEIEEIKMDSNKRLAIQSTNILSPIKKPVLNSSINKENHPNSEQQIYFNSSTTVAIKSPFKSPFKNYNSVSPLKKIPSPFLFTSSTKKINVSVRKDPTSITRKLSFSEKESPSTNFIIPSVKNFNQPRKVSVNKTKIYENIDRNKSENLKLCQCFNKPQVCNICMMKKTKHAQRAGTPGFRPPEVLLKHTQQTTAVDIWAVGVILLCILSGCYPMFRATNDIIALAELCTLFGSEAMKNLARMLGQSLIYSESKKPINLKRLCIALRARFNQKNPHTNSWCNICKQNKTDLCLCFTDKIESNYFPDSAYDLLIKLLDINYVTRITAADALKHPFLCDI